MIDVQNLTRYFAGVPAVKDVSFFVPKGQVVGFLGPNGAGKTTTMRMITGFLPPTEGSVVVDGINLDVDPVGIRRRIGYLPEHVPLYPEMRVNEYLEFRAAIEGVPRSQVKESIDYVVDRCMLGDVRNQVIGTLSRGYRQRVGLAAALIHKPPVLILDEPTIGLDPNQVAKVRELIRELASDHTIMLSTHILSEVEAVCDRVILIHRGKIRADGALEDVVAQVKGMQGVTAKFLEDDPEQVDAVLAIPGVKSCQKVGDELRITVEPGKDVRADIFRLAVDKGWTLLELHATGATLEEVFRQLTAAEPSEGGVQ